MRKVKTRKDNRRLFSKEQLGYKDKGWTDDALMGEL